MLKRVNVTLVSCLIALSLVLTACPAPGDGTIEGGEAPLEDTTEDIGEETTD